MENCGTYSGYHHSIVRVTVIYSDGYCALMNACSTPSKKQNVSDIRDHLSTIH